MLSALGTENSPFNEQELQSLKQCIGALNPAQSQWLSGYLAGIVAGGLPVEAAPDAAGAEALTILYGSETGNGESLAVQLADEARQAGLSVKLQSLDGFRPAQLKKLGAAAFVISTHGEGDPPEEAVELFEYLDGGRAPKLDGLNFRVLALGDRSYELFCEAGRRLDERLVELGATRYGARIDCDVDYSAEAGQFGTEVIAWATDHLEQAGTGGPSHLSVVPSSPQWTRENPYSAEVTRAQRITDQASGKDVHHIEMSLEGSGLRYQPGDALGVWAPNDAALVAHILESLSIDGHETVEHEGDRHRVSDALIEHREITRLTRDTVVNYARKVGQDEFAARFEALDAEERRAFIENRQFADLVDEAPGRLDAQTLFDLLRPLGPRSYSIASSLAWAEDEVHLTVATLESNAIGTPRRGVASQFLNHRVAEGAAVRVFVEPNRRFHLPENRETPLILIGAGTGVAPYRAFLQELEAAGANPDTWLIFGNPHRRTDFLYQREFLKWRQSGLLDRIDAAWSRDQAEKRYVQHIVAEQAERIDAWLRAGAHIYVCGGLGMGHAVQDALQQGLAKFRGLDDATAAEAISALRRDKRLRKDLY